MIGTNHKIEFHCQLCYDRIRRMNELNKKLIARARENLSFMWEPVKVLPEHRREAVHLFYHEGYATTEIASILRRWEVTIRSDLHQGRKMLEDVQVVPKLRKPSPWQNCPNWWTLRCKQDSYCLYAGGNHILFLLERNGPDSVQ